MQKGSAMRRVQRRAPVALCRMTRPLVINIVTIMMMHSAARASRAAIAGRYR